jgi:hypothetical protein
MKDEEWRMRNEWRIKIWFINGINISVLREKWNKEKRKGKERKEKEIKRMRWK